jgi:CHAD domain-containing protein
MRVTTRRLRALLQIIYDVAPAKQARQHRKELKQLAQALAPVRDCDVFLEQVSGYSEHLPEQERAGINVLTEALLRDRVAGRYTLLTYLDSPEYEAFKSHFATFVIDNAKGWDRTLRVRDLVGSRIWQRYEELRAYETLLDMHTISSTTLDEAQETTLHEARIAGKRLRYLLETFAEVLGPQANQCVNSLKELQDHLGMLQDIAVARAYIAGLKVDKASRPAIEAYLASRKDERARLLDDVPRCWEQVMGETYLRNLAGLLTHL